MQADLSVKAQANLQSVSVAELRAQALKEKCAHTVEARITDIVCASADDSERAQALLDIAIARNDLPHIQVRSCRDLSIIDPSRARQLVRYLLKEPPSEERDRVRARAFATLVELPNITEQEVLAVAHGLRDRFPIVREHILTAIKLLPAERFRELEALISTLSVQKGPHVVQLRELIAARAAGEGRGSGAELKPVRRGAQSLCIDSPLPSVSQSSQARPRTTTGVRSSAVRDGSPSTKPPAQVGRAASEATPPFGDTHARQSAVVPTISSPENASSGLASSPSNKALLNSASIEAIRVESLSSKTWAELLAQQDRYEDPRMLCACIAEMAVRFGADATLGAAAAKLCFVASHSDPDIKRMSAALTHYLFQ